MAALIIASLTMKVITSGATQRESEPIGEETRAFSGNLRSSVRAEKRKWSFECYFAFQADLDALRAAVPNRAFVTCSGTLLPSSLTCRVVIGDAPYRKRSITSVWRTASIELTEV